MSRRISFMKWVFTNPKKVPTQRITPEPDSTARPTTGPISNIENTQSDERGWQKVVVFTPQKNGESFKGSYHVGFMVRSAPWYLVPLFFVLFGETKRLAMRCTVSLGHDQIGMLCGPGEAEFFAWDADTGEPLELSIVGYTTRNELPQAIPLI